jgi:DNA polymerase-3 subunit epsilon
MKLNLKNPIVFFDLETTGINVITDRIVEISILKIFTDGHEESRTYRVNPEMPIPPEVTEIHGISDDDVKDSPKFREIAKNIAQFIEGADIGGFNSNKFDIPVLAEEFIRADVDIDLKKRKFVDVQTIFHKMEKRTLEAAYKLYCGKDLDNAHSAEADTRATYEVLLAQLDRYPDLKNDIEFLADFSSFNRNVDFVGRMIYNDNNEEIFNFGKYKGQKVEDVLEKDPGFFSWMLNNDFPLDTKRVLTNIKLRKLTKK